MTREKKNSTDGPAEGTIGRLLQARREELGQTPMQVAAATKMMEKHVLAMEDNNFASLGAAVYVKGFIKIYADHLGLDTDEILKDYARKYTRRAPDQIPGGPVEGQVTPSINPQARPRPPARPAEPMSRKVQRAAQSARQIKSQIPWEELRKWLIQAGFVLFLLAVLLGTIIGTRSCVSAGQRRRALSDRRDRDRAAVIEVAPDPYLQSPHGRENP